MLNITPNLKTVVFVLAYHQVSVTTHVSVSTYKTCFIITEHIDEVKNYILNDLKRGGTCFPGQGLYQGHERKMIYVTLDRGDLVKLKSNLRQLDPNAFVNVIESSEIMGYGFKALPEE